MPGAVAVVVPFTPGLCAHRDTAWAWVQARYADRHPDWELVTAPAHGDAWCKADAVASALAQTDADLLVVADADVWCDLTAKAVSAVVAGAAWAVPHQDVWRLNDQATVQALAGRWPPPGDVVEPVYRGVPGGGLVALRRETYEAVPLDPRFVGWGGEDESWGCALTALAGRHWRGRAPLYHLWHPPAPRLSRGVGSRPNQLLQRRYLNAQGSRRQMTTIVQEARACRCSSCSTAP